MIHEYIHIVNTLDAEIDIPTRVKRMAIRADEYAKNSLSVLFTNHVSDIAKHAKNNIIWGGKLIAVGSVPDEHKKHVVKVDLNAIIHALDGCLETIQEGAERLEDAVNDDSSQRALKAGKDMDKYIQDFLTHVQTFLDDKNFFEISALRSKLLAERFSTFTAYLFVVNDWCKEITSPKHLQDDLLQAINLYRNTKKLSSLFERMEKQLENNSADDLVHVIREQQKALQRVFHI